MREEAEALGVVPGQWYEDSESLLYCVYERASTQRPTGLKDATKASAVREQ